MSFLSDDSFIINRPGVQLASWRAAAELRRPAFINALTKLGYTPPLTQRRLLSFETSPKRANKETESILKVLRSTAKNELVTAFEEGGRTLIRTDMEGQVAIYGNLAQPPLFESGNSKLYDSLRHLVTATRGGEAESRVVDSFIYLAQKIHDDIKAGCPLLTHDGELNRELSRLAAVLSILVQYFNNRYHSSDAEKICNWISNLGIDFDCMSEIEVSRLRLTIARNELELHLHRLDLDQAVEPINELVRIPSGLLSNPLKKIRDYWIVTASVVIGAIRGMDGLQLDMSSISSIWAALTASDPELRRNPLAAAIHAAFDGA